MSFKKDHGEDMFNIYRFREVKENLGHKGYRRKLQCRGTGFKEGKFSFANSP